MEPKREAGPHLQLHSPPNDILKTSYEGDFLLDLIRQGKIDEENPWFDAIMKGYVRIVEFSDPLYPDNHILAVLTPQYGFLVWNDKPDKLSSSSIVDGTARTIGPPNPKDRWHLKEIDGVFAETGTMDGGRYVAVAAYDLSTLRVGAVGCLREEDKKHSMIPLDGTDPIDPKR